MDFSASLIMVASCINNTSFGWLHVKYWFGETDDDDGEDNDTKDERSGDFFKLKAAIALFNGAINSFGHESKDGENNSKLGDNDAKVHESIDDEPGVTEESDFCEHGAEDKCGKTVVVHVVVLGKDVASGTVADDKLEQCDNNGIDVRGEDTDGGRADENSKESLGEVPAFGCFGLDDGEPNDIDGGEDIMRGKNRRAGEEGEENDREANNKVDEVAFYIEPEIMWTDGEHAPFGQEDENESDNPGAGNDGCKD